MRRFLTVAPRLEDTAAARIARIGRAGVVVPAEPRRVHAPPLGITGGGRAGVVVVACCLGSRLTRAGPREARVADGAGVSVVAGRSIRQGRIRPIRTGTASATCATTVPERRTATRRTATETFSATVVTTAPRSPTRTSATRTMTAPAMPASDLAVPLPDQVRGRADGSARRRV